ncbi:hypothetical protein [Streptomyces sp. NPDC090445]|uniref:hypothetical protein n=1 Tax=Streptomyces sp. NPDC090445 TaxID=3365963 RepID=UPI00380FEB74
MVIPVPVSWDPGILKMAESITCDILRIRAILGQLGIRNADYEDPDQQLLPGPLKPDPPRTRQDC